MTNLKKRHIIRVQNMRSNESSKTIEENLQRVLGIDDIIADNQSGKVDICYNLKFINYISLGKKLGELGYPPSKSILNSFKRAFIGFTEKNELAGLQLKSSH